MEAKTIKLMRELTLAGVGVIKKDHIVYELNEGWFDNIVITTERYYEIILNRKSNKFSLHTTFSNQELTTEYLQKLVDIRIILNKFN